MPIIDISLPLSAQLPTWPGNAPFEWTPVKRLASGGSSNVSRLVLGSHSGTHVDAPRHFFDDGEGVGELSLDVLMGPCRVVEVEGDTFPAGQGRGIGLPELRRAAGSPPERLLLKTRNSTLWARDDFSPDFASLTPEAAAWAVAHGVRLVGIDYLSIERFKSPGAPTHHTLLAAAVVVIEGLNLADVAPGAYELICLPLRIPGADGAPARVVLRR
jgi:arylformamidase